MRPRLRPLPPTDSTSPSWISSKVRRSFMRIWSAWEVQIVSRCRLHDSQFEDLRELWCGRLLLFLHAIQHPAREIVEYAAEPDQPRFACVPLAHGHRRRGEHDRSLLGVLRHVERPDGLSRIRIEPIEQAAT